VVVVGALLWLSVAATRAAATASTRPPIVQVRVDGGLVCTATVVAPRFVLTAAHCARRGTSTVAPARLTIVAPGRHVDLLRVAAVDAAPSLGGRSVDLALLQLTAGSTLQPARLPAAVTASVRAGKPAHVFGWASNTSAKRVRARLAPARRCGSGLRGTLCVALERRAPSTRCADAGGAALTVRRAGRPVVVGVGTLGRRGCGRDPALPFVDVRSAAIRNWAAGTIAQTVGAPAASPLAAFVGHWSGTIYEDSESPASYPADISVDRDGTVQEVLGSSRYALGACGGTLTFQGPAADGSVSFLEALTYGQSDCIAGGTVTLTLVAGQPAITYAWIKGPDDGRSSGVLQRAP
jgi:hypothetical protein